MVVNRLTSSHGRAEVAEQADASVSKADVRKDVRVRLPLSAPRRLQRFQVALGFGPDFGARFWVCARPLPPGLASRAAATSPQGREASLRREVLRLRSPL